MSELIQSPTPQAETPTLLPVDFMVEETAALIGGAADPRARSRALRALDRAARRMNLAGVYLYRRKEHDYTLISDPAFTDGASSLVLPSDFGWPTDPFLMLNSDGEVVGGCEWIPWEQLRGVMNSTATPGTPSYVSIRDEIGDNRVYLHSPIEADDVATVRLTYLARLQKPSEVAGQTDVALVMSDETLEAILTGAEYFIMRHRYKDAPQVWRQFYVDFERCIIHARAAASRQQQAFHMSMRPDGHMVIPGVGLRPTYIQV